MMRNRNALTGAVLTAILGLSIAAPNVGAAPLFYTYPSEVLLPEVSEHGEGIPVTLEGELQSETGPGHAFRSGPCVFHGVGELWNTETKGDGTITEMTMSPHCPSNIPGCTVVEGGIQGEPFPISTGTEETPSKEIDGTVTIQGFEFFNIYNDGCTLLGVPPGVPIGASGDLTATTTTDGCIDFSTSGDIKSASGATFPITGEICFTDLDEEGNPQGRGSITIH